MGNKHIAKKIAYFVADLDETDISNPKKLAKLIENFLDSEDDFPFDKEDFKNLETHLRDQDDDF